MPHYFLIIEDVSLRSYQALPFENIRSAALALFQECERTRGRVVVATADGQELSTCEIYRRVQVENWKLTQPKAPVTTVEDTKLPALGRRASFID